MVAKVVVDLGPARSGKTYGLLGRYRSALREGNAVGRSLWIAPTSRAAAQIREQLVAGGLVACLAPGVTTFDELTAAIMAERLEPVAPVKACAQRDLVRRVVRRAMENGRLPSFAVTALSSGFIDLVVEHIRELKRREIDPADLAKSANRRPSSEEHHELSQLYADYQQALAEHGLADREGEHWLARDELAREETMRGKQAAGNTPAGGGWRSHEKLELVVVDGFTDFTPTQHDVLGLLAARAGELRIALPGEAARGEDERRPDLFAKTKVTLAELKQHHRGLEVCHYTEREVPARAIGFVATQLFGDPRRAAKLPAALPVRGQLEIVAAAGQQGEIVEIARRIKRRLASGEAQPGDVVVVLRSLQSSAARVREVFTEFGIPLAVESSERLLQSPVVRGLLGLLRLAEEDWPFRRVVATINNNLLSAIPTNARRAANWLVRELQIAKGREALLARIEQLASTPATERAFSEHFERRVSAAREAAAAIRLLADALGELPEKAALDEWCDALERLGSRVGLSPFASLSTRLLAEFGAAQAADASSAAIRDQLADRAAWDCVVRHLSALARLDAELGESPRVLSRNELLPLLVDVVTHEPLPSLRDETGRVRVLSAASARTVTAKHVYLAGMSEQAFPSPEPAGRLYSEEDYRSFQRVANSGANAEGRVPGSSLPSANRSQEEMLLFYEVLTRAEESLTISYPALDDKAQVLPASPYLTEIERLLGEKVVAECKSLPQPAPLAKGAEKESPLGPADWRLRAVHNAIEGDRQLLAGVFASATPAAAAIDAGLRITHWRGRNEFGPADGLLQREAVAERLARRFGSQHLWSPSQWEQYAACPYKFFLSDVLGLSPLGDLTLETDFGRRGSLLHHVLATFHRAGRASLKELAKVESKEESLARLIAVLEGTVAAAPRGGVDGALVELDKRQIAKWAEKHYDHLVAFEAAAGCDERLAPAHFELRFGPPRKGDAGGDDRSSIDKPFEIDIGGEKVQVTGRIDRIDTGRVDDRQVFSVIDYKTGRNVGSLKAEQIASGERLQLPIYVAAAQALLFKDKATPIAAGYWTMERGFDQRGVLGIEQQASDDRGDDKVDKGEKGNKWEELQGQVAARVGQFVHDIRHGDFPVYSRDENCTGRCEFSTVCRVAQVRSRGKVWEGDSSGERGARSEE